MSDLYSKNLDESLIINEFLKFIQKRHVKGTRRCNIQDQNNVNICVDVEMKRQDQIIEYSKVPPKIGIIDSLMWEKRIHKILIKFQ